MSFWPAHVAMELRPLKYLARFNPEVLSEDTDPDFEFDYIDIGGVTLEDGVRHKETMRFETAPSRARKPVRPGDVIVSTVRTYLKAVARIGEAHNGAIVSTGFAVLRPNADVDAGYLYRLCQANAFVADVEARSTGVSYPAISPSALAAIKVPFPDRDTQKAIAAFLDRETARIDKLIAKKERLTALLKEKLENEILRAVTLGIDPEAQLVPENELEWTTHRPAHWRLFRLKHFFRENTKYSLDGQDILLSLRMKEGLIPHNEVSDKEVLPDDLVNYKKVHPGQIVMNRMRAAIGLFGLADRVGIVSPDYSIFDVSSKAHAAYFLRLFKTEPMMTAFRTPRKTHGAERLGVIPYRCGGREGSDGGSGRVLRHR